MKPRLRPALRGALGASAGLLIASLAAAESSVPPRTKGALLAWLRSGAYRTSFTPEPAFGRGLRGCTGCHGSGTDYLLSDFRP